MRGRSGIGGRGQAIFKLRLTRGTLASMKDVTDKLASLLASFLATHSKDDITQSWCSGVLRRIITHRGYTVGIEVATHLVTMPRTLAVGTSLECSFTSGRLYVTWFAAHPCNGDVTHI